ncbi:hypothetical protein IAT38_004767 [Cryptococcus sp. DSM 104549]
MSLAYLQQESTPGISDSIWDVAWTSQNKIISASADGHLRVWDADDLPQPIHDIASHPLGISRLSTSFDGQLALAASIDGTVVLADIEGGKRLANIETGKEKLPDSEHALPAFACALHPKKSCWAWSGRSSKVAIRSIDANSLAEALDAEGEGADQGPLDGEGKTVDSGKGRYGMDLQFSPDGRSLALASEQGQVVVIDTETNAIMATYTSHNKTVRTLSWSSDSQWLFSGSDDNLIVLYDVRAGSQSGVGGKGEGAVALMQGHQSWVLKVAASPDGKILGSGGADNVVKLWDIGQRNCVSTSSSSAEVWGLAWQPAGASSLAVGKQFAIAGDDKTVTLYRAAGAV